MKGSAIPRGRRENLRPVGKALKCRHMEIIGVPIFAKTLAFLDRELFFAARLGFAEFSILKTVMKSFLNRDGAGKPEVRARGLDR